jgi:hypothetical protein
MLYAEIDAMGGARADPGARIIGPTDRHKAWMRLAAQIGAAYRRVRV